ncbi:MAG: LON peptidase substrate-binding domain-containing protein [Rhodospirillaceae bacterium]|nr:LON peptidase substrate-binding domain-containing protein [Rhodospirillaceae bacterium]
MGHNQISSLPSQIALFPLSGVVLMPFAHIPLNVFEERYINLVDDSFANGHYIGIVQPQVDAPDPVPGDVALYKTGTIARIISFFDASDGTYQITLQGVMRFRVISEQLADGGYRTAMVDYMPYVDDLALMTESEGTSREQLISLMHNFLEEKDIEVNWEAVNEASYSALVSSLVMTCPFSSVEKQALLELGDQAQRAEMLIQLFNMSGDGQATSSSRH